MSWRQLAAVIDAQCRGGPSSKLVLLVMANHACENCGLAWPGLKCLERETQLGRSRISLALEELVTDGALRVHAYAKGGRGMSTEYVVSPTIPALLTAPCQRCLVNMSKPSTRRMVSAKSAENHPRGGLFSQNHPENTPKTIHVVDPNHQLEPEPPGARARDVEAATPPALPHRPMTTAEAKERATEQLRALETHLSTRKPSK